MGPSLVLSSSLKMMPDTMTDVTLGMKKMVETKPLFLPMILLLSIMAAMRATGRMTNTLPMV